MTVLIGEGHDRLDGRAKVTGAARYCGDVHIPRQAHAALVLSTVAAGQVIRVVGPGANHATGIIAELTHENAPRIRPGPYRTWLQSPIIHHAGQPVALVVAETEREAQDAAAHTSITYAPQPVRPRLSSASAEPIAAPSILNEAAESCRGDLLEGREAAHAVVEATYTTPTHCHNPMEPHVVVACWDGERVTVHTSTSGIFAARRMIAHAMEIPEQNVRVLMRHQGGGFGGKGSAWWPTLILAVSAARMLNRPVRLELRREQMFTVVGRRAPTVQRLAMGADVGGRLTFIEHEAIQETSPLLDYSDPTCFATRIVYSCPNVATRHLLVRANVPQPNAMRAPGEGPGSFALESALDELAFALRLDPLKLRLKNIALRDEHRNLDWSSNSLKECLTTGARAFGWVSRPSGRGRKRGRMRGIGQGVASAYYPVFQSPAAASLQIDAGSQVTLYCGNQDIGSGSLTVMAQAVASALGITADEVVVQYGDTNLPETPMAAGAMSCASVIPAIERAARQLIANVVRHACEDPRSPLYGCNAESVGWISPRKITSGNDLRTVGVSELAERLGISGWNASGNAAPAAVPDQTGSAFGACFAEVQVDRAVGMVQVTRLTSAYAAGRILNEKLARSQFIGGLVFGIGMALYEGLQEDALTGLPVNRNLTGYLLPAHANVPDIDVQLIEEPDTNPASHGIKGIGMIGTVGVAAAIANAVFDATGQRIRDLPITPGRLLA